MAKKLKVWLNNIIPLHCTVVIRSYKIFVTDRVSIHFLCFKVPLEIPGGRGGHQRPPGMENPGGCGGANQRVFRGGGMDIIFLEPHNKSTSIF